MSSLLPFDLNLMNFDLNLPMVEEEEQNSTNPHDITSFDVNKVLQANIIYMNKKRKFQDEQVGLPLLKHKCRDRNLNSDSPSDETLIKNNYEKHILKEKAVSVATKDESELESVEDSNGVDVNNMDYSSTSVSNEENTKSDISISTSDTSATISLSNGSFSSNPYSLDSRSKLPKNVGDCVYPRYNFGPNACMDYDESLLEFGCDVDCSDSVQNESSATEQCKDKEIEDILYSNGMPPNYMLSSGKWSYNKEDQWGTKKLTIDKEFEEYFSMLML